MIKVAEARAAHVVNVKPMKAGLVEAMEIVTVARAAGLGLMIGGMVEGKMAMSASACLAAGFGGFAFVDLDTPPLPRARTRSTAATPKRARSSRSLPSAAATGPFRVPRGSEGQRGSSIRTATLGGPSSMNRTRPPCASIAARAMGRPSPEPPL